MKLRKTTVIMLIIEAASAIATALLMEAEQTQDIKELVTEQMETMNLE